MKVRLDEQPTNVVDGFERTERFQEPITEQTGERGAGAPPDYPAAPEAEEPYDEEPLRVSVVEGEDRSLEPMDWNGRRVYVDDARPVKIVGRNINRRRVLIRNDGASAVYVGRTENENVSSMFELASADTGGSRHEAEMWHQAEVWAVCDSGDNTMVSVLAEFIPQEAE